MVNYIPAAAPGIFPDMFTRDKYHKEKSRDFRRWLGKGSNQNQPALPDSTPLTTIADMLVLTQAQVDGRVYTPATKKSYKNPYAGMNEDLHNDERQYVFDFIALFKGNNGDLVNESI